MKKYFITKHKFFLPDEIPIPLKESKYCDVFEWSIGNMIITYR
jgi:hypothetical protein